MKPYGNEMEPSSKGTLIKMKWNTHKMEHSSKGNGTLIKRKTHKKEMEHSSKGNEHP